MMPWSTNAPLSQPIPSSAFGHRPDPPTRNYIISQIRTQYRGKGFKGYGLMYIQRREWENAIGCFKKAVTFFRERSFRNPVVTFFSERRHAQPHQQAWC